MTASDPGQAQPVQPSSESKKNVRVLQRLPQERDRRVHPFLPGKAGLLHHLIRAIETANPDFAWVQFLFVKSSYGPS